MKFLIRPFLLFFLFMLVAWQVDQELLWEANNGIIHIRSDAPLEVIQAESKSLQGIINPKKKTFAFSVRINSFQGFNSQIQRTHFLENYMEEKKFPTATFEGKFIENIPFNVPGTYSVRAKGVLDIHGVSRERIIRGELIITKTTTEVSTSFFVPVSDHDINIPKIVNQKIAEEIAVTIDVLFENKNAP